MPLPDCVVISGVHRVTHFMVCGYDSYVICYRHVRLLSGRVVYLKLVEGICISIYFTAVVSLSVAFCYLSLPVEGYLRFKTQWLQIQYGCKLRQNRVRKHEHMRT